MNHYPQVVSYTEEVTYIRGSAAPDIQQQPPLPPPRRRLTPFRKLVRAFIAVCTIIGVLAVLIWLIYRPRTIQVAVAAATLARFDLDTTISTSPVLSYNLTARMVISNPNRRVSIFYDQLRAVGFYQAENFGRTALPVVSFQGVRRTDTVPAVLVGSSPMGFGDSGVAVFRDNAKSGVFPVDLWVDGVVHSCGTSSAS